MIVYTSANGQVIGFVSANSELDLKGITRIPSGSDYAVFVSDGLNPNPANLPGTYTMTNIVAGATLYVPTATGTLTFTEQPASEQLANAQQAQILYLKSQLLNTYNAGFSSPATGTSITYPFDPIYQIKWNYLLSIIGAGMFPTAGVQVKDLAGNVYTITSQTVAKQLCTDAMNFYLTWDTHYHTLVSQVQSATTVSAVQAVTW